MLFALVFGVWPMGMNGSSIRGSTRRAYRYKHHTYDGRQYHYKASVSRRTATVAPCCRLRRYWKIEELWSSDDMWSITESSEASRGASEGFRQ